MRRDYLLSSLLGPIRGHSREPHLADGSGCAALTAYNYDLLRSALGLPLRSRGKKALTECMAPRAFTLNYEVRGIVVFYQRGGKNDNSRIP